MFTKLEFAFFKFINKILRFSRWIITRSALSGQTTYNQLYYNKLTLKPMTKKWTKSGTPKSMQRGKWKKVTVSFL